MGIPVRTCTAGGLVGEAATGFVRRTKSAHMGRV